MIIKMNYALETRRNKRNRQKSPNLWINKKAVLIFKTEKVNITQISR